MTTKVSSPGGMASAGAVPKRQRVRHRRARADRQPDTCSRAQLPWWGSLLISIAIAVVFACIRVFLCPRAQPADNDRTALLAERPPAVVPTAAPLGMQNTAYAPLR